MLRTATVAPYSMYYNNRFLNFSPRLNTKPRHKRKPSCIYTATK